MARSGYAATIRRREREAARYRRELALEAKHRDKWLAVKHAQYEVQVYENQIAFVLSMHKDCGPIWEWSAVLASQPPPIPERTNVFETAAREAAVRYSPGFFEKLFSNVERRRAELQQAILEGQGQDVAAYAEAYSAYIAQVELLQWQQRMAHGVMSGDVAAYATVVEELAPFDELVDAGMTVRVRTLRLDVAVLDCIVRDGSIVPMEEKKLTAAGKLSTKKLALGTYWGYYQDYVCGCALRVAREVYALLPLPRVVVNVCTPGIDSSTGHECVQTVLAVSIPRGTLMALNFDALDPSDAMRNFSPRMKFKKTTGFEPVDPIHADEAFVMTGR